MCCCAKTEGEECVKSNDGAVRAAKVIYGKSSITKKVHLNLLISAVTLCLREVSGRHRGTLLVQ